MNWLITILLSVIFLFTPYQAGLFFDKDMYIIETFILISFITWATFAIFAKKARVSISYFIIFLIPLMYLVTFIPAESIKNNFDSLLRWLTYGSFFILLLWLRKDKIQEQTLQYVFHVFGLMLAGFSIFGYVGWIEYNDLMVADRLTGPFQYANTFAAVMGALLVYSLISLIQKKLNITNMLLLGIPLVTYGTSFLLSYSRGAFIVLPIAWFVGLALLKLREQILYIALTFVTVVGSLVSFSLFSKVGVSKWLGLMSILVFTVVIIVGIIQLNKSRFLVKLDSFINKEFLQRWGRVFVIIGLIVIAGMLLLDILNQGLVYQTLPQSLQQRIDQVDLQTSSALGRTNMYEDALRMSQDYPIFGAGGDGWKTLYPLYQESPYYSNEIHNGYLEILLDIGWLGAFIFIFVSVCFVISMFRYRKKQENEGYVAVTAAIAALFMLMVHSALDFNFSYGVFWFIVLMLIATNVSRDEPLFKFKNLIGITLKTKSVMTYSTIGVISLFVFVGMFFSIRFYMAEQQVSSLSGSIQLQAGIQVFEKVRQYNPYHVDYGITLANFYAQMANASGQTDYKLKAIKQIDYLSSLEPKNAKVIFQTGQVFAQLDEWDASLERFDQVLKYDRFNVEYYNYIINLKTQLGMSFHAMDEAEKGNTLFRSALIYYESYLEWFNFFKDKSIPDRRPMEVSKDTNVAIARTYLKLGDANKSLDILKKYKPTMDPGIYNPEKDELITNSFEIVTMLDILKRHSDQIIVISARDEASSKLSQDAVLYLQNKGSQIADLKHRGSFATVIAKGEIIAEGLNNQGDVLITSQNNSAIRDRFKGNSFEIYSAGYTSGNQSMIVLNEQEFSINQRGMNIAVFDNTLNFVRSYNFDTNIADVALLNL